MSLRDRINADLTAAMKSRDAERLSVLRMMKTAVRNREIDVRGELDDAAVVQLLGTLIKQRKESATQFRQGGRPELADKEEAEVKVIESYLPAAPSDEEILAAVEEVVRAIGASGPKDMGRVMKECMARFAGRPVDGRKVSALVKERLEQSR